MFFLRDLKAISLLALLLVGCSHETNSAGEMSKQVIQKTNVSPLLAKAYETQKVEDYFKQGNNFLESHRYQDAIAEYEKALQIKPDKYEAWINQGIALTKLARYTEAIVAYDKAIAIHPKKHEAYYNKACSYALQNNIELTTQNLQKAIKLYPKKYQQLAKSDPDFDKVRRNKRFQELLQ